MDKRQCFILEVLLLVSLATFTLTDSLQQFYGGSLSYSIHKRPDAKYTISMELITGWVLGKGPCGPNCTKSDIGRSTVTTRQQMMNAQNNPSWFGSFHIYYHNDLNNLTVEQDWTRILWSNMTEKVIGLSETEAWEQDVLESKFQLPDNTEELVLNYDGHSWKTLTLQAGLYNRGDVYWHFQVKIATTIRNDTGRTNQPPRALAKPYYRVKLGSVTAIRLPTIDEEGDQIKCEMAGGREGGHIASHPPPQVSVTDDCTIYVNASDSSGYQDDTWIGVPVSVSDYNTMISVQFLVQVLANLPGPDFVNPTSEGNHGFILYSDTTWGMNIYAGAQSDRTIEAFAVYGINNENYISSPIKQDSQRPQVKYIEISWKPVKKDIGMHILCVQVTDNTGMDSEDLRCFRLKVIDKNDCSPDPCRHGTCTDMVNDYSCSCNAGYTGKNCSVDINDCIPNQCKHGTCIDMVNGYSCSCETGYSGKDCSININDCSPNPCRHGTCTDMVNDYSCSCNAGYTGKDCSVDINDCLPNPCRHGTCKDMVNDYSCSCNTGYTGKDCSVDINDCLPNPCRHGTCTDMVNDYSCTCNAGYTGKDCSVDINDCSPNPCRHGTCTDMVNNYSCSCNGYTGKDCSVDKNDCSPNPCQHGSCTDMVNDYSCSCYAGYTGKNCSVDINDCFSAPCLHGSCIDKLNDYSCSCEAGYTGKNCSIDIDDCSPPPCHHGTCTDKLNGYSCSCEAGYAGKDCSIRIVDACTSDQCINGGQCIDYVCVCPVGFAGKHCERVSDPCNPDPCERGLCFHHGIQYHCVCPPGFTGKRCELNINDCISGPCLNTGTCIDGVNTFSCNCASGFTGNLCQIDIDECQSNPCLNGGFCEDGINQFICLCRTGFDGDRCQDVEDPCARHPCVRGECFSRGSEFMCVCPAHYTGKLCEQPVQIDPPGSQEEYIRLPVGGNLVLNCSVSGASHQNQFIWHKLSSCGGPVESHSGPVYSQRVSFGDIGTYECNVQGSTGHSVTKVFHLNVTTNQIVDNSTFEDGHLGVWTQLSKDKFDWKMQSGPTLTNASGPNNDHTLGNGLGKYLFIESTPPRVFGEYASLVSPLLPANHSMCLEFWYFMYGSGVGRLLVHLEDSCLQKENELLKIEGNQGERWIKASLTIYFSLIPNDYRLIITADVGTSYQGDIAIDDIVLLDGVCKNSLAGPSIVG